MGLQSAILAFGLFRILEKNSLAAGFTMEENVIVQTTAVSTATMPLAAGEQSRLRRSGPTSTLPVTGNTPDFIHLTEECPLLKRLSECLHTVVLFRLTALSARIAGLVGVIPALTMMTPDQNPPGGAVVLSSWKLILWSLGLAFIGVFCAVPLRTQTILREKLRFPSGAAPMDSAYCRQKCCKTCTFELAV